MTKPSRRLTVLACCSVFLAMSAAAEPAAPSPQTAKQAARCSIVASMAADTAKSKEAAAGSKTMSRLMLKLAVVGAGRQQTIAWLDELEAEFRGSADLSFLRQETDVCRALIAEQSEWLDILLHQAN